MELKEALLIVAVLVVLLFITIYFEKRLSPKGKIIASFISTVLLSGMFTYTLVENFTYTRLAITSLLLMVSVYSFYRRYKNYKEGLSTD